MTVESTTIKTRYQGNGAAVEFPTGFAFAEAGHVRAVLRRPLGDGFEDVDLVPGADFSLSGAGTGAPGTLTYPAAGPPLAEGEALTIHQDVPMTQEKSWGDMDVIDTAEIEKADDKLTRICLQLAEGLERCVKMPVASEADPADPEALLEAGRVAETARTEAEAARDEARAAAAGVNLPPVGAGDAGKTLAVRGGEDGYELRPLGSAAALDAAPGGAGGLLRADGDGSALTGVRGTDAQARAQAGRNAHNVVLLAFRQAVANGLGVQNMADGVVDEFEDATGVDAGAGAGAVQIAGLQAFAGASAEAVLTECVDSSDDKIWGSIRPLVGESFTLAEAVLVDKATLFSSVIDGNPSGNALCRIYRTTGTVGVDAMPSGEALGVSDPVDVEPWTTTGSDRDFVFASPVVLEPGDYCVIFDASGVVEDVNNRLRIWYDETAPAYPGNGIEGAALGSLTVPPLSADLRFGLKGRTLGDMTLVSATFEADAAPDAAAVVLFEQDVDVVTPGADIKAFVSRDGGTAWTQATLTAEGDYDDGRRILSGEVDVGGQPAGTSMRWKITTHNGKALILHGAALEWK